MTQPPHSTAELSPPPATPAAKAPSVWRAWFYLLRTSWQRQARAHLMVWIAAGLILFLALFVALITTRDVWDVRTWRQPRRGGLTFAEWTLYARFAPRSTLAYRPPLDALKPEPRRSDLWASLYQEWNHAHFHAPGDGQRAVMERTALAALRFDNAVTGRAGGRRINAQHAEAANFAR